jgi:hypothetical protein
MTAPTSALERVIRRAGTRRQAAEERCEVCSVPVPPVHRHLLDTEDSVLMCVCQACSLLFSRDAASEGHYRLVPQRRTRLGAVSTKDLGVPVGLAYFVPRGDGAVIAHYPSPAGATQWEVDPQAWVDVVDHCPTLRTLVPDVEALLVNTVRGEQHCWLVPIDDCLRLVAVVRQKWKGLSGGTEVWPEIERFFTELKEQR